MPVNVTNPPGTSYEGTSEDDSFTITDSRVRYFIDGESGYDDLTVNRSARSVATIFTVDDIFGEGSFFARASEVYGLDTVFYDMEDVHFVGASRDDVFFLTLSAKSAGLRVNFEAGAGHDMLIFDFSTYGRGIRFVEDGSASNGSSYGQFSGFEQYSVYGGSGNDTIRTDDGNDDLRGGGGTNILFGGGGDDFVYSTSITDLSDGGTGHFDYWGSNYDDALTPLAIEVGHVIKVNGKTAAKNFDAVQVGAGQGDDVITLLQPPASTSIYGNGGHDTLVSMLDVSEAQSFVGRTDLSGHFSGAITYARSQAADGAIGFSEIETLDFHGGTGDDRFDVAGIFSAGQVDFDGGTGSDTLMAQFDLLRGGTRFVVAADGTIDSNRGTFARIDTFILFGGAGADRMITQGGRDVLSGGGGNDTLSSGGGDDDVQGGTGLNRLDGGAGFDAVGADFSAAAKGVLLDLNRTGEQLSGGGDGSILNFETVSQLTGSRFADVFVDGAGFGLMSATGGAILDTGAGNDEVTLYSLGRSVSMGDGADHLTVDLSAADGTYAFSTYIFGSGPEGLFGYLNSYVAGNSGPPIQFYYVESLTILTGAGADAIGTGAGADIISTGAGDDSIHGGIGNDLLDGGAGNDMIDGGAGIDIASYATAAAGVAVDLGRADAQDTGGAGSDTLSGIEALVGSTFADTLAGDAGANSLRGGAGDDLLIGGGGDDALSGDAGIDTASYSNAAAAVKVDLAYALGQQTGDGRVTLARIENLVGSGHADTLRGSAGGNRLDGGLGADLLQGRGGHDRYLVDDAGDRVVEAAGGGLDTVIASVNYRLGAGQEIETLELAGTADLDATGNEFANRISGNAGDNGIDGGAGADVMRGGLGDDHFVVDDAGDRVYESNDEGIDGVESRIAFSLVGQFVETLTLTGAAAIDGIGNPLANILTGNAAANRLDGGAGDDGLHGGLGSDVLVGGSGHDAFWFDSALNASHNVDAIQDFRAADDVIMLSAAIFQALPAGPLAAGAFHAGAAAHDADDRILYDAATGHLLYDADGTGAARAMLFATLAPGTEIGSADFLIA